VLVSNVVSSPSRLARLLARDDFVVAAELSVPAAPPVNRRIEGTALGVDILSRMERAIVAPAPQAAA
jgi:hypothetical protein